MKKIIIKILVLISIFLIFLGPVFGVFLDKITILDQSFVISATSNTDIENATAYDFTLSKGQKISIEFSVNTENVSATLKILRKAYYIEENESSSLPNNVLGENFIYSKFTYGDNPDLQVSTATSRNIDADGYYYIEFAGNIASNKLISIPGDYVVFVYGSNSGGGPNVYFDLLIKTDGSGEIVETWLILIGVGALLAIMLLVTVGYLKKTGRGLL